MKSKLTTVKSLLYYTFGIVPVVAGIDKFTNILTDWSQYLAPFLSNIIPFESSTFLMLVGIIEIIAGLCVLFRPGIGAYMVAVWLILIALSLIFSGAFIDVAVRDLVMAVAAYSLAVLSNNTNKKFPGM